MRTVRLLSPRPLFLLLLAAATIVSCGGRITANPDLLLITIDTARADHFSYGGASPVSTPEIDKLAMEGTAFLNAVTPAPITLPAHASLLTGLLPQSHGVRNNGSYRLPDDVVTLAELLTQKGYDTAAFVAAAVLNSRYGLDQGFSTYDDAVGAKGTAGLFQYPRRRGDKVVEAALSWLNKRPSGRPTFAWVHLFDPHAPYEAPEPERSNYPGAPYAASISFVDRVIGELLEGYRRSGRYKDAIIVLTSDHGESLGEHGEATHGVFLFDATVHVPLVLRGPELERGLQVETQVRLIDVFPTLLSLLELDAPRDIDGVDLSTLLRGGQPQGLLAAHLESQLPREDYGWSEMTGIRIDGWKLIKGIDFELYDLEADPNELVDLAAEEPDRVAALARSLRAEASRAEARRRPDRLKIDDSTRAELVALGYLSSGVSPEPKGEASRPDPRQRITVLNRLIEALALFASGNSEAAVAVFGEIAAEEPGSFIVQGQLGNLLALAGRYEDALAAYERAALLAADNAEVHKNRGHCLERLGRFEEALLAYDHALEADPGFSSARERRWNLMRHLGRAEEVAQEAEKILLDHPRDLGAHLGLARALEATGDNAAGRQTLLRGLDIEPESPDLKAALGRLEAATGAPDVGLRLLEEVLEAHPTHVAAAAAAGNLLLARNEVAKARLILETAAKTALPAPDVLTLLAEARVRMGEVSGGLKLAERSVRLLPDSARAWATLGSVLQLSNRWEDAGEAYRRALTLDADDRTAALNLAMTYERLGRDMEAEHLRNQYSDGS